MTDTTAVPPQNSIDLRNAYVVVRDARPAHLEVRSNTTALGIPANAIVTSFTLASSVVVVREDNSTVS